MSVPDIAQHTLGECGALTRALRYLSTSHATGRPVAGFSRGLTVAGYSRELTRAEGCARGCLSPLS
eukprot:2594303-Rhodomonas_salina.1